MTGDTREDAPFVSIIMLAYNQRDLIEEAIASLLAQDYPNFELIVSDDCSSDGTFEKMCEIADAYKGPQALRINQTIVNKGTLSHLYQAAALSDGRLVVAAGGDDVSLPHRVSMLVAAWLDSDADALFSNYTVIDAAGNPVPNESYVANDGIRAYFPDREALSVFGATAAYDRRVFDTITPPEEPLYFEDLFLSLMIHYRGGRVVGLEDQLVRYRKHENSLTNSHGSSISVRNAELKSTKLALNAAAILRNFRKMLEKEVSCGTATPGVSLKAVREVERFYEYSAVWHEIGFAERVRAVSRLRFAEHLRWAAPRMFGLPVFLGMKALQERLRSGRRCR